MSVNAVLTYFYLFAASVVLGISLALWLLTAVTDKHQKNTEGSGLGSE